MPFVTAEKETGPLEPVVEPVTRQPLSERGVWRSAFDLESDITALVEIVEQQSIPMDPEFNLPEYGKDDPLFEAYTGEFLGAQSAAEYDLIQARLRSKIASRETLERSGLNAFAATLVAGIVSPTTLLPGGAVVRGARLGTTALKTAGTTSAAAAAAVGIQEAILQENVNDRTLFESATNVAAGALLGGALGAGVGALAGRIPTPRSFDEEVIVPYEAPSAVPTPAVEAADDAAIPPGIVVSDEAGPPINPTGDEAVAEAADGDVRLDSALGTATFFGKVSRFAALNSPTVSGYLNDIPAIRDSMRALDSGGLLFRDSEGKIVAGSDVASRKKAWEGQYKRAHEASKVAIKEYQKMVPRAVGRLGKKDIMELASDYIEGGASNISSKLYFDIDDATLSTVKKVVEAYQEHVFRPFYDEAQRLGFTDSEKWMNPDEYVPHKVRRQIVTGKHEEFVEVLTEYFAELIGGRVNSALNKLEERTAGRQQAIQDLEASPEEFDELEEMLTTHIEVMKDRPDAKKKVRVMKKRLSNLRKGKVALERRMLKQNEEISRVEDVQFREINRLMAKALHLSTRPSLMKQTVETLETTGLITYGDEARVFVRRPQDIKEADLTQLDKDIKKVYAEAKRLVKMFPSYQFLLDRLDENPTRFNKAFQSEKIIDFVNWDRDKEVDEHIAQLKKQVRSARGRLGHERKNKKGKPEQENVARIKELEEEIEQKLKEIKYFKKELRELNEFARDVRLRTHARNALTSKFADTLQTRLLDLNDAKTAIMRRRERRLMELIEDKKKYDPELVAERKAEIQEDIDRDYGNVYARLVKQGLLDEGGDIAGAEFNIGKIARKQAEVTSSKFLKEVGRIPLVSTLLERGPELDRTLNIDPLRVWSNGYRYADFMERDLDHLARIYTRTVGADFEVYRTFGSVNPIGKGAEFIERVNKEVEDMRAKAKEELEGKEAEKALARINREYTRGVKEIREVVERARDMRGIPEDPESIPWRAGKALLNLNTLRLMGGVVIASVADPANLVKRLGVESIYRDGLRHMFTNFKALEAGAREARYAGAGLDLLTHARLQAMSDTVDDYGVGGRAERLLQFGTNNMGRIALFDFWNAFWKQTVGTITMQRIIHDIEVLQTGKGDRAAAERFLAHINIGEEEANAIWAEIQAGGASNYKGVLVPNTEDWQDPQVAQMFRQAIVRMTDDTIVTPGFERPAIMDETMFGKLVFQFRSFAFASITKTLLYSAQELKYGNLNILAGSGMALALGAASWYTWSILAGEDQAARMRNADYDKWMDESINRSGLLGPLQEILNIGSKIPGVADFVQFSGESTSKSYRPFDDPIIDAGGPSVGFVKDLQKAIGTASEPNQTTFKAIRRLSPLANVSYIRPVLNTLEDEVYK